MTAEVKMTDERIIKELRKHGHGAAARRIEQLQAEVAELRATVRLKSALIGVAARVVSEAA